MNTYTVTMTFTTADTTDEHLRDEQAIKDEIGSWLESLGAEVVRITTEVQS